jgi:hypothetical protein
MDIKFKQTGGPYGDAASSYDVIIPEGTTVRTFVRYIAYVHSIYGGEWGSIDMYYNDKPGLSNRVPLVEYKRGRATYAKDCNPEIFGRLADKIITKVRAHGGWSNMDYDVYVD